MIYPQEYQGFFSVTYGAKKGERLLTVNIIKKKSGALACDRETSRFDAIIVVRKGWKTYNMKVEARYSNAWLPRTILLRISMSLEGLFNHQRLIAI